MDHEIFQIWPMRHKRPNIIRPINFHSQQNFCVFVLGLDLCSSNRCQENKCLNKTTQRPQKHTHTLIVIFSWIIRRKTTRRYFTKKFWWQYQKNFKNSKHQNWFSDKKPFSRWSGSHVRLLCRERKRETAKS